MCVCHFVLKVQPVVKNSKKMGERCLQERHDDVIERQKRAIADMRNSLKECGYSAKPSSK